ncbi:hypothetical protein BJX65DRAFT_314655 [Aspergillus insuetus]
MSLIKVCPDELRMISWRISSSMPKRTAMAGSRLKVGLHEDTNKNSHKYDPFRFSRVREAAASAGADSTTANTLSFVSTSPDFLAFSHAKHACPGRFLVDFELKMIIAYVLTHYNIQFSEE